MQYISQTVISPSYVLLKLMFTCLKLFLEILIVQLCLLQILTTAHSLVPHTKNNILKLLLYCYWLSTPATLAASVDLSELMLKSHIDRRNNCRLLQFPEICIMLWDKSTYYIFNSVTGLFSGFCNTCLFPLSLCFEFIWCVGAPYDA
jgi:hypothetical protein